jgi:plastocyanin
VRKLAAGVTLAVAGALWAAPALGDATITAGPDPNTYATTDVTIDQGQTITFQNSDRDAIHDVTADRKGSNGAALFRSETIENGKTTPVKGVEFLTTGDYGYHCSVHPFMTGTLHVTGNGMPKPRDTTAPDASVAIVDSRISGVLEHKGVTIRLRSDEPARFKLTATAGKTKVATGTIDVKGTKRNAKLALTRSGKRLLFRASTVKLKLTAQVTDAADNRSSASASRTLR